MSPGRGLLASLAIAASSVVAACGTSGATATQDAGGSEGQPSCASCSDAGSSAFPLTDAGDGGAFAAISAQCAASPSPPLTGGSYTDPVTGLTLHWPAGWTFTQSGSNTTFSTLTTPVTWVPTGSMTTIQDVATFTFSVVSYGNADQVPQAVPGAISNATQAGGAGAAVTLAGHPAAVWWQLVPPAQPGCPAPCEGVAPYPELLTFGGLVQFPTVDAGGDNGVEIDLTGSARADAQPAQVFCDMEAMMLGVTLAP